MSVGDRGMKGALPVIVTSCLQLNASGRYTSLRLGMSNHDSFWIRITLESDVTRILK